MRPIRSIFKREKTKVFPLVKSPIPLLGADLGKEGDYTALAVIMAHPVRRITEVLGKEPKIEETILYTCPRLERPELGTEYNVIVERIVDMLLKLTLGGQGVSLCVDAVGPGIGLTPWIKREWQEASRGSKARMKPCWIWTTATGTAHHDGEKYVVSRRELVTATKLVMQQGRFEAAKMPLRDTLQQEMRTFTVKQNARTGFETFEHYRENDKDDLVTSVAMPLWLAERYILPTIQRSYGAERRRAEPGEFFYAQPTPAAPLPADTPQPEGTTPITRTPTPPRM